MTGLLRFLGTGGSVGVPMLGCECHICLSADKKNHRLRPSVLFEINKLKILVDPGPDFRMQALRFGVKKIDAVLITHGHHDHVGGLDDLRPICYRRDTPLPVYASVESAADLQNRFSYLFQSASSEPHMVLRTFSDTVGSLDVLGVSVDYVSYSQGGITVNGYRVGNLAYLPDIRKYSQDIFTQLQGVQKVIVGALRFTPSLMHFSVDEAIDFIHKLNADEGWLTHLSHDLDYTHTNAYLPNNIRMSYDGLQIVVN